MAEKDPEKVLAEALKDENFKRKNSELDRFGHSGSVEDLYRPINTTGRQRHTKGGREGVPQLSSGIPKLRDTIDPNDPETLPGPLKVTKLSETPDNK